MSLVIRDTSVGYRRRKVLENLQLEPLEAGSLVAVLGPNGVGKSTLLKGLAGLLHCQGTQELHGEPLQQLPHWRRNQLIGYLPQSLPQATSLVVYECLYAACRVGLADISGQTIEQRIEQVVAELGIHSLALRRLSELSGGQRQMVGLAQVLVRKPQLLLLDEPTSALDLRWQLTVLERVKRVSRDSGAIALVASHDLNLALRFCDQVLLLGPGGTCRLGPPAQVLTADSLAQSYSVVARMEQCSLGFPLALADRPLDTPTDSISSNHLLLSGEVHGHQ